MRPKRKKPRTNSARTHTSQSSFAKNKIFGVQTKQLHWKKTTKNTVETQRHHSCVPTTWCFNAYGVSNSIPQVQTRTNESADLTQTQPTRPLLNLCHATGQMWISKLTNAKHSRIRQPLVQTNTNHRLKANFSPQHACVILSSLSFTLGASL